MDEWRAQKEEALEDLIATFTPEEWAARLRA
jgi:hypothetical protein